MGVSAAIAVLALLTACSGDDDADGAKAGPPETQAQGAPAAAPQAPVPQERQIVASAAVRVEVKSVADAARAAVAAVEEAGGYVGQQQVDLKGDPRAELELRVPPGALTATLDRLAGLGDVLDRSSKAEEVTAKVIDLEGRLKTLQASADRLRGLIREGRTTADIVAVEGELARRETDIESLQGQLRVLRDQIGLASVKASFTQPPPPVTTAEEKGSRIPGFVPGLRAGWRAMVDAVAVALTVLGATLPFSPAIAALAWLARRRRRAAAELSSAALGR